MFCRALALILTLCFTPAALFAETSAWSPVGGPEDCARTFPEAYGPHLERRTEWWYWTGNLADQQGRRWSFQVTFFRAGLGNGPEQVQDGRSTWRAGHLIVGHAQVSEHGSGRFEQAEVSARMAAGLAGAETGDGGLTVFVRDWRAELRNGRHLLRVQTRQFGLDLELQALKPPVFHGEGGYSRKGAKPESASCYHSFTRMKATGSLRLDGPEGETVPVEGLAWKDQESSTALLEPDVTGWDWLSLQLADGREVMLFELRLRDGRRSPASSGSVVEADGRLTRLAAGEFMLTPTGRWKSPRSGAEYPSGWRLTIPGIGLDGRIEPETRDREMNMTATTGVNYWEGAVRLESNSGETLGRGFFELTGYDRPFAAPL